MTKHLVDHLEEDVNWNKFFSIADALYSDKGFSTNADNFARTVALEKALSACSSLIRVDQKGYDFTFNQQDPPEVKVELKVARQMFKKRDPFSTKLFKVKSFLSAKKTVEDFQEETTFDYLLVMDLCARRVVVVEDEIARSLYVAGADGAEMRLTKGDYYECELPPVITSESKLVLSEEINFAVDRFIKSF